MNDYSLTKGSLGSNKSLLESQGTRGDLRTKTGSNDLAEAPTDISNHPRPWTKLPRKRRTKLAIMGLGRELLETGDPRYRQCMELADKYRKARTKELATIHGFVSSGTSALLATASLALAASRFLYEKAAEGGQVDLMSKAAKMADSARQAELAAWELAAREGMVKKKIDAANISAPWVITDGKAKPGRKTNAERQRIDALPRLPERPVITIDAVLSEPLGKENPDDQEAVDGSSVREGPGNGEPLPWSVPEVSDDAV